MDNTSLPSGAALLPELFTGGIAGTTGGFVCGGIAMILRWLLGTFISYLLLIVAALLLLLAGMQITIPSIIRAIQNRPRPDWEDEVEERQEPAAVVVNHLTNKYIEREEQRRQRSVKDQSSKPTKPPYDIEKNNTIHKESNADAIIRQIESDVSEPVVASGSHQPADTTQKKEYQIPNENIIFSEPTEMPPLERSEPISVEAVTAIAADVKKERVTQKDAEESAVEIAIEIAQAEDTPSQEYCFPPIDLLNKTAGDAADGTAEMRENSARLNETLASFKIEAHIINVTRGPSVTRYEVELAKGVRLSKLTSAADDIALSLGSTGVRIAAIPGKISVVGIEVPNRAVTTVSL
jgi:S-DNA-T family DNA segregation ATPase FtsK/SpoIIIE